MSQGQALLAITLFVVSYLSLLNDILSQSHMTLIDLYRQVATLLLNLFEDCCYRQQLVVKESFARKAGIRL